MCSSKNDLCYIHLSLVVLVGNCKCYAYLPVRSTQNPPSIPPELEGVLREIAVVGVPYYGWGGLKELLAARMAEAVGALEKDSGFLRAAGGKDYQQRRCGGVFGCVERPLAFCQLQPTGRYFTLCVSSGSVGLYCMHVRTTYARRRYVGMYDGSIFARESLRNFVYI